MAYRVTVYSEVEKAAHRRLVEERGVPVADLSMWDGKELRLNLRRPESNLVSEKEWTETLVAAVRGCRRSDGVGRGLTKAEFQTAVMDAVVFAEDQLEELYEGCLKAAQMERSPLYGSTPAQIRSYARKAMNQRGRIGVSGIGAIVWQSKGGYDNRLTPAQAKRLQNALGW
jgi:hypothetical protein